MRSSSIEGSLGCKGSSSITLRRRETIYSSLQSEEGMQQASTAQSDFRYFESLPRRDSLSEESRADDISPLPV